MQRIELMGPPGVGKSTLLARLHGGQVSGGSGLVHTSWLPLRATHERKRPGAVVRRLETALYGRKGLQRWMRPKLEKEMIRHALRDLRDASAPWPDFLQRAMTMPAAEESPALLLERMRSFAFSAAQARVADTLEGPGQVVFDEGLGQRGISLGQGAARELVDDYFRLMPAPSAVIRIEAPVDEIQGRLERRNPEVRRFHSMVEEALEIGAVGSERLGERGIPVIRLDGGASLDSTTRALSDALESLSRDQPGATRSGSVG